MNDMTQRIEALTQSLGLDAKEIAQRKAFLELTHEDEARLLRVHTLLGDRASSFTDAFYEHLQQFDAMKRLLKAEGQLDRLKHVQGRYFNTLTAGEYGPDYVRDRLRVGVVHQRIGLEPNWYLGAYRKYLSEMHTMLWDVLSNEPDEYLKTCDALIKVVNFDIGLALDTYFQADTEEIREHKDYGDNIFSAMPNGLMVISANLIVLSTNPAMRAMLQLPDDTTGEGLPLSALVKSSLLLEACTDVFETGDEQKKMLVTLSRDSQRLKVDMNLSRIQFRGKHLLLITAQDITEKLRVEAQLAQSEERYRLTFDLAAVGMAQADTEGRITKTNRKLCEILGYDQDELLGVKFQQLTQAEDRDDMHVMFHRVLNGSFESYSKERRCLNKSGQVIWTNVTVSCLREDGKRTGLIVVLEDITSRKHMEQELVHMAGHDSLTGLLNRVLLQDRLSKALVQARRLNKQVAVLYIDLDNFKHVNDSRGHAAGDAMMAEAGRRLLRSVRDFDTVARIGGDEFVVMLENLNGSHEASARAQNILRAMAVPFVYKGKVFHIGSSIGIAMSNSEGMDGDTLLKNADSAMGQAKEAGRNNAQFYMPELNAQHARRIQIADALRMALDSNELQLHYQPKIDALTGEMVGLEALLRWFRADGTQVFPDDFIPVAEHSGMILPIGEWVLHQACRQVAAWRERADPKLRVSVNMSTRQLKNPDIVQVVKNALREAQCPADALEIEITESVLMEHPETTTKTLQALYDMGVRLSIDDFGTGYSSLSYLRNFPIHELKIDRSFIDDITHDDSHATIVKAIINLAHNLRLTVVAEGVETDEQLQYLREQRCDYLQGYLFSRPLPASEIEGLLGTTLL